MKIQTIDICVRKCMIDIQLNAANKSYGLEEYVTNVEPPADIHRQISIHCIQLVCIHIYFFQLYDFALVPIPCSLSSIHI